MVGVDDNWSLIGVQDPKLEDRIRDSVDNSIEPLLRLHFERKERGGEEILLIEVDVGDNPHTCFGDKPLSGQEERTG